MRCRTMHTAIAIALNVHTDNLGAGVIGREGFQALIVTEKVMAQFSA